jgi:hypothetical protein
VLGKEFIAVLRERPLPKMEGREGAMFTIYWGKVSADSDGPVEMCKPVPESDAKALASHYPELNLRIEPAHREAYVALPNDALPAGPAGNPGVLSAANPFLIPLTFLTSNGIGGGQLVEEVKRLRGTIARMEEQYDTTGFPVDLRAKARTTFGHDARRSSRSMPVARFSGLRPRSADIA